VNSVQAIVISVQLRKRTETQPAELTQLISDQTLIKDRTACRNRLQAARNKVVLAAQLRARLRQVERQIGQIDDAELARLVAEDPALTHRFGILLSIPGIGPVATIAMLVEMPERGTMDGKEAAGLAPITRRSGKWKGQSRIGGGRRGLRRALYMPASSPPGTTGRSARPIRRSAARESPRKSRSPP
jgi:transposase